MLPHLLVRRVAGSVADMREGGAGPWKPWNEAEAGEYTQLGYEFLYNMFSEGNGFPAGGYRERYLNYDGPELRQQLTANLRILIPDDVKPYVFDCESLQINDPSK